MVNIYEQKLTNLQQKILRVLMIKSGISLNALNIARAINVSQPAISKSILYLVKENYILVEKDKESGRFAIQLNRENPFVMQLKRIENLKLIYESRLANFLEKEFAGGTIIIFGSYSRGDDTINSDIDFAIIGRKEKLIKLDKFEKILERKINISFYNSFGDIHKNLKENIFNGFVLFGGVEL